MGYPEDEESVSGSRPIWLYTFTTPLTTYRHTNATVALVYGGNTYTPLAITHDDLTGSGIGDPADLALEIPWNAQVAIDNLYGIMPYKCHVSVFRYQQVSAVAIRLWEGPVTEVEKAGARTKLRIPSTVSDALETPIPAKSFQSNCGHQLFDTVTCKVVLDASRVVNTTIATISTDGRTLTLASIGAKPDGWAQNGVLVRNTDGERRVVERQVGTTITLYLPFRALAVGNSVTQQQGCKRTHIACRDDFNNIKNYGGHPFIRDEDIFDAGFPT